MITEGVVTLNSNNESLLEKINSPADLRQMPQSDMPALCSEIRGFLTENVMKTGGHLASNLGVVELSVALHRVFDTPNDRIIFDVGHQSYTHKILTGRRGRFDTLRKAGGLSGFEKRSESEYDCFGTGHSSTAISAALGFAVADKLAGRKNYTIAVVGDGAFTGGEAHEALNNCRRDLNLIIILNENEMSIAKNTGSFANYIAKVRSSKRYLSAKKRTGKFLKSIPGIGNAIFAFVRDRKKSIKNSLYNSNYFEELGLFYLGPANGNNYDTVEYLLREAKSKGESVILHLKTKKGLGYAPAEKQPELYHSIPCGGPKTAYNFSKKFGDILSDMAKSDESVCAVTAAMPDGTGLTPFSKEFPQRFFDVGIAEGHALTFAAGLAAAGMKPYVAVYSSFLQRAYDSIIHDIALQNLPVRIMVDRAGLAQSDGATHHGIFDVAFLSHIPNIKIFAPATFASLERIMRASLQAETPIAVRYPNSAESELIKSEFPDAENSSKLVHANFDNADKIECIIITYGTIATEAVEAAKKLCSVGRESGVVLLEMLKPYEVTAELISKHIPRGRAAVIFLEEGIENGGAAMITLDTLREKYPALMKNKECAIRAIDDNFALQSNDERIYKTCKLCANDIIRTAISLLAKIKNDTPD